MKRKTLSQWKLTMGEDTVVDGALDRFLAVDTNVAGAVHRADNAELLAGLRGSNTWGIHASVRNRLNSPPLNGQAKLSREQKNKRSRK